MAAQDSNLVAAFHVPNTGSVIIGSSHNTFAIWTESNLGYFAHFQYSELLSTLGIPNAGCLIVGGSYDMFAIAAECCTSHCAGMIRESRDDFAAFRIPDAGGVVRGCGHHSLAIGLKSVLNTSASWPFKTIFSWCPPASHSRAVESRDVVRISPPSGLNTAFTTSPSWPFETTISAPVSASQMRAVRSDEAVTTF